MRLLPAIWYTIKNPPVEFEGDWKAPERYSRADSWALTRPMWTHTIFTTEAGCGCRRRFGLWHTMWCAPHCFSGLTETTEQPDR